MKSAECFVAAMEELRDQLGALDDVVTGPDVIEKHRLADHPARDDVVSPADKASLIDAAQTALDAVIDAERSLLEPPCPQQRQRCRNARVENVGIGPRGLSLPGRAADRQSVSETLQRIERHLDPIFGFPLGELTPRLQGRSAGILIDPADREPLGNGRPRIGWVYHPVIGAVPDRNWRPRFLVGRDGANEIAPVSGRSRHTGFHRTQGRHRIPGGSQRHAGENRGSSKQSGICRQQGRGKRASRRQSRDVNPRTVDPMPAAGEFDHLPHRHQFASIAGDRARTKPIEASLRVVSFRLLRIEENKPALARQRGETARGIEAFGRLPTSMQHHHQRRLGGHPAGHIELHGEPPGVAAEALDFAQSLFCRGTPGFLGSNCRLKQIFLQDPAQSLLRFEDLRQRFRELEFHRYVLFEDVLDALPWHAPPSTDECLLPDIAARSHRHA